MTSHLPLGNKPSSTSCRFLREWAGWLLAGLIIRLVLVPFSLHVDPGFTGDIAAMNRHAYLIVFDPTSPLRAWPTYPLPAYYTMALFQMLLNPFSPPIPLEISGHLALTTWVTTPSVFRQLFCFKVWYLLFDLGTACLLWCMFRHDRRKVRAILFFWIFNPVIIYNAYLHGQFDVVPIFFTVLALYFAQKGRSNWAILFIVVAAGYKVYPLFFLPPALLILYRSWRERAKLLLLGIVPFLLLLLPHLAEHNLNVSIYGDWFFKVSYDVGLGGRVYVFFAIYAALLWYIEHTKVEGSEALWRVFFITLLIYYPLSYFDLHYWAWIVPFAAIYWVEHKAPYVVILACLLVLTAPTPLARFLAPISPRFFLRLPSLLEALNPYLPALFLINVARSLVTGTCFYLAWRLLRIEDRGLKIEGLSA